ncbi:hypothetical protein VSDG_03850 [Cytospora chrysosperma]|uniref:RING-type domain-containing protein n=1 Tax=Cytospora chrysosperma TaxID=252740 RepID=A0A423W7R4_CYTCH|nr:hypothetical protein VSDG_03850 [Valsa sordida]
MVLDNPELNDMAYLAVRTLHYQVRDVVANTVSSAISSATTTPDPTPASPLASSATSQSVQPLTTTTQGTGGGSGSGGQGSSPLLFFVALGFGVVFTNLWIIVGVKYCFRYNARNRNIRITGEDGEPINLENMPPHPRRRRREKKLMTMDEVNEKFPMMKYKSWVASRAQEGLPTRGGISQPPTRANSINDADGIISANKERDSTDERPVTSGASISKQVSENATIEHDEEKSASATSADVGRRSTSGPAASTRTDSPASDDEHDDDEDDRIHDALPPEMLESSGDTCAICIDTLEDDDDPRPGPAEGMDGAQMGPTVSMSQDPRNNRGNRMNMPSRPGVVWTLARGRGRLNLPIFGRNRNNEPDQSQTQRRGDRYRERQQQRSNYNSRQETQRSRPSPRTRSEPNTQGNTGGFLSSIRQHIPGFGRSGATGNQSGTNAGVTPSNLEAGTRTDGAR